MSVYACKRVDEHAIALTGSEFFYFVLIVLIGKHITPGLSVLTPALHVFIISLSLSLSLSGSVSPFLSFFLSFSLALKVAVSQLFLLLSFGVSPSLVHPPVSVCVCVPTSHLLGLVLVSEEGIPIAVKSL